jgi:hypothetical protein
MVNPSVASSFSSGGAMKKLLRNNGLSIVMFLLFAGFWAGQSIAGWMHHNQEQQEHGKPAQPWSAYVTSGEFVEATAENWESEFFQMAAFVILSGILVQRGSAESKDPGRKGEEAAKTRKGAASPRPVHRGGLALAFYSHSLTIALAALFLFSFAVHAVGGRAAFNEESALHGGPTVSFWQFLASSTFWFQSFQNWQSEFLSVGVLVVLSIFLREKGSSQSKRVGASHSETGSEA